MTGRDEANPRVLEEIAAQVRVCTRCRLHAGRTNAVPGEGSDHARILLLGEAPGRDEDASGRPFVGRAGKTLDRALRAADLDRESVFITNVVKCRPPSNRTPKPDEIAACSPFLAAQLAALGPCVVVTLGETALQRLVKSPGRLRDQRGRLLETPDARVLATYHPAAIRYGRDREALLRRDLLAAARAAGGIGEAPRRGRTEHHGATGKSSGRGREATR